MNITSVRVHVFPNPRPSKVLLRGFAEVVFDDQFVIRGLRILESPEHTYVGMPSRRKSDGTFEDICHPLNRDFHRVLENKVLDEYEDALNKESQEHTNELTRE